MAARVIKASRAEMDRRATLGRRDNLAYVIILFNILLFCRVDQFQTERLDLLVHLDAMASLVILEPMDTPAFLDRMGR
jgi:hypothetical protein